MALFTDDKPSISDEECDLLERLFFKENEISPEVNLDAGMSNPKRSYRSRRKNKLSTKTLNWNHSEQNHDNWLGYLVAIFIKETVLHAKECCPGCNDRKNSPLLHAHQHSGLLEKLVMFHPIVRESMLSKMTVLVKNYVELFPDPEIYDEAGQKILKTFGRDFLIQSSPTFIYYSHYLTPECDEIISETPKIHIKPMTLKRVATKMEKINPPRKKARKKDIAKEEDTI